MGRQYVTYEQVRRALHRPWPICRYTADGTMECEPTHYLRTLRAETGLSWAKLAHDLSVDSGCVVNRVTAYRWANG